MKPYKLKTILKNKNKTNQSWTNRISVVKLFPHMSCCPYPSGGGSMVRFRKRNSYIAFKFHLLLPPIPQDNIYIFYMKTPSKWMPKKDDFRIIILEEWKVKNHTQSIARTKPWSHVEVVFLIDNQVKPSALQQMVYKSNPGTAQYGSLFKWIN